MDQETKDRAEPDDEIERLRAWVRVLLDDRGNGYLRHGSDVYAEAKAIVAYRHPFPNAGQGLFELSLGCLVRDLADEVAALRTRVRELESPAVEKSIKIEPKVNDGKQET